MSKTQPHARTELGDQKEDGEGDRELEGDPIIGELRKLYDGVVDEPLPEELLELLRRLDDIERNR